VKRRNLTVQQKRDESATGRELADVKKPGSVLPDGCPPGYDRALVIATLISQHRFDPRRDYIRLMRQWGITRGSLREDERTARTIIRTLVSPDAQLIRNNLVLGQIRDDWDGSITGSPDKKAAVMSARAINEALGLTERPSLTEKRVSVLTDDQIRALKKRADEEVALAIAASCPKPVALPQGEVEEGEVEGDTSYSEAE